MLRIFLTDESFRTAAEDLMFDKLVELEMMRNERNKALRELQTYRDRVVNTNVIGAAGSARLDNLIMSSAKNFGTAHSPYEIADLIKRAVLADTWKETKDEDGEPQSYNIDILLICDSNLYRIGSDFSVTPIPEFTFVAAGSGENLALGAAFATKNKKPKEILKVAIQAAIKHDPHCGGTFVIDEIEL